MGQSSSEKNTLLYILGGLDVPTSGFVFQFYNLIPNLNVEENIMLPLLLDDKKMRDFKKPLKDILEIVGLADKRKHTPPLMLRLCVINFHCNHNMFLPYLFRCDIIISTGVL